MGPFPIILNIWLSLSLYNISHHPFVPPSEYESFSIKINLPPIQESLKSLKFNLGNQLAMIKSKLNKTEYDLHYERSLTITNDRVTAALMLLVNNNLVESYIESYSSRSKRGLFNFMGYMSKQLFGTATSYDIDRINKIVLANNQLTMDNSKLNANFINITSHRLSQIHTMIERGHKHLNSLSNLFQDFIIETHEIEEVIGSLSDLSDTNQSLENIKNLLISIRNISMMKKNDYMGHYLHELLTVHLYDSKRKLNIENLITAYFQSFSWDSNIIYINGIYIPSSNSGNLNDNWKITTFESIQVGHTGLVISLNFSVPNLIQSSDNKIIGYLDEYCSPFKKSTWSSQLCPVKYFNEYQLSCLYNILVNHSIELCGITHYVNDVTHQKLDNHVWLVDTSRLKCPKQESDNTYGISLFSNLEDIICVNIVTNKTVILHGTHITLDPITIVPLAFLSSSPDFKNNQIHVLNSTLRLSSLMSYLRKETEDWENIKNLSSQLFKEYIVHASKNYEEGQHLLSNMLLNEKHKNWINIIIDWIIPIISVMTFCEVNFGLLVFILLWKPTHATSMIQPNNLIWTKFEIIGYYIMIISCLFVVILMIWLYLFIKRTIKPSCHLLQAKDIPLIPGGIHVYLRIASMGPDSNLRYYNILIGTTLSYEVRLPDNALECNIEVRSTSLLKCIHYKWLEINHFGLYVSINDKLVPTNHKLIVPLPLHHTIAVDHVCTPISVVVSHGFI